MNDPVRVGLTAVAGGEIFPVSDVMEGRGQSDDGFVIEGLRVCAAGDLALQDAMGERDDAVDMRWIVRGIVAGHAVGHVGCHGLDEGLVGHCVVGGLYIEYEDL